MSEDEDAIGPKKERVQNAKAMSWIMPQQHPCVRPDPNQRKQNKETTRQKANGGERKEPQRLTFYHVKKAITKTKWSNFVHFKMFKTVKYRVYMSKICEVTLAFLKKKGW